jgi:hexosaminidase
MIGTFPNERVALVYRLLIGVVLTVVMWLSTGTMNAQAALTIIPQPAKMQERAGIFALRADTVVAYSKGDAGEVAETAQYLADVLASATGLHLKTMARADAEPLDAGIVFVRQHAAENLGEEGYVLEVTSDGIVIRANTAAGMFYAVQTLRQLLQQKAVERNSATPSHPSVPCVRIEDRPRFRWRGLMLDPARNFLTTDFINRYIDILARYKLNRLQLHLTDGQNWTVEIKKYPQLTEMGRWPVQSTRVRGVYTQDTLRKLIAYAASRHVTLVPEVELPGHSTIPCWIMSEALLCSNNPYRAHRKPFKEEEAVSWLEPCAASPKILEIYKNILREVMAILPGPYVHLGGDEYFGWAWERCPDCQRLIATKNLRRDDTEELRRLFGASGRLGSKDKYLLYRYLMTQVCDFVSSQGRQPVVWDDLAWRGRFPRGVVVMQWHYQGGLDYMQQLKTPENPAVEAAQAGHDVVIAPFSHLYLNASESKDTSPDKLYSLDPMPAGLTLDQQSRILGPHALVWEHRQEEIDGRTFPRLYALAEIAWTPGQMRDLKEFRQRIAVHERQRAGERQSP